MPDSFKQFEIVFKTIADATGITKIGENIDSLKGRVEEFGRTANEALGLLGLGLGIEKLNELGNKALEARGKLAVFAQQIAGGVGGSNELVAKLTEFNEQLAKTTGTLPETSRAIEQLFSRAGVPAENLQRLTHGVIEFAASSAGTVQPLELASIVARRLSGASGEADLSLGRLGIRAKSLSGIMQEFDQRGGESAETFNKASGGAAQFAVELSDAQESLGNFVNLFRVPFITGFANGLQTAKEKLDGMSNSADGLGQKIFIAMKIAADSIGGLFSRGSAIFTELLNESKVVGGKIAQFVLNVVTSVVEGAGAIVTDAITVIDNLARHAADLARELSHGFIDIKFSDPDDSVAKAKITGFTSWVKDKLDGVSDSIGKTVDSSYNRVAEVADQISKSKPPLIDALFGNKEYLDGLKKEYAAFVSFQKTAATGVAPGSRVGSTGAGTDAATAEKAATDALTQSKYQLSAAQQIYETEVEQTKGLEESGAISVDQADRQRNAALRDYTANLQKVAEQLPKVIDLQEKSGDTKGLAASRLLLIEIGKQITKNNSEAGNTTVFGKIRAQLVQLKNEWSDIGKQVGGFLTNQFQNFASSAGNLISGLLFRTTSWKDAILGLGEQFVASLATMLIQWVLARTIISALNAAFGAGDSQLVNKQAESAATAWAPAAIAASIASYGAAAGFGLAAYLAAIGVGTAGGAVAAGVGGAGFAEGGYTGGIAGQPAGVVHGQEFVFSNPAVQHFGVDFLRNLHSIGVSRPSTSGGSASSSGGVAGAGASRPNDAPHIYVFTDRDAMLKHWQRNPSSRKQVIDWVNGAGGSLRT